MQDRSSWRPAVRMVALAMVLAVGASACVPTIAWRAGKTHGAIIEPTAGRASVGIYRKPTRDLYKVYRASGIGMVQSFLFARGGPRVHLTLHWRGVLRSVSQVALSRKIRGYIYGDTSDLRGALLDAHRHRDCLALTLISRGLYIKNWTHKRTGCREGSSR